MKNNTNPGKKIKIIPVKRNILPVKKYKLSARKKKNVRETRGFAPRCVKAESLDPEGTMIGYETKNKRMNKKHI